MVGTEVRWGGTVGTAVSYDVYLRPTEVERALEILAGGGAAPARATTTRVLLPDRRRVDLSGHHVVHGMPVGRIHLPGTRFANIEELGAAMRLAQRDGSEDH